MLLTHCWATGPLIWGELLQDSAQDLGEKGAAGGDKKPAIVPFLLWLRLLTW
jgi:hypothetical protein